MRLETRMVPEVAEQLGQGLRALVIEQVQERPDARRRLAAGFSVPEESVDRMIEAEHWDLPLAMSAAQHLGVQVRVTHNA